MSTRFSLASEWLEADGLGGFASGTVSGIRTRRYHGLLLAAATPPTGRLLLVQGFDAWVQRPGGTFAISSQRYVPDVTHPDGAGRIESFEPEPWPRWRYRLEDGTLVEQEIFVRHGSPLVGLRWRLTEPRPDTRLILRPFLSGRDYHSMHHENGAFRFEPSAEGGMLVWRPYEGIPGIVVASNGTYTHEPHWYRGFEYSEERNRGLDSTEDAASPGTFGFDLSAGDAVVILGAQIGAEPVLPAGRPAAEVFAEMERGERERRSRFRTRLDRSADAYLVRRGNGTTIIAGYPWFTDWGRDTFIALRGLCLATGRIEEAGDILNEWAHAVSEGMLPNRFADHGDVPEFNSVDASLWYVVAVHDYLQALGAKRPPACWICGADGGCLDGAVQEILEGYSKGTRHGIRMDEDGLLAAGEPGVQLTWMDAKVGDWVVTPRIGKPVEIQALWLNALRIGARFSPRWEALWKRGAESFPARFWNETASCLYDVVDVDHRHGALDATLRPNQIFAVGGLPYSLLEGEEAWCVVEAVEMRLLTPLGLRSLAPGEIGYQPHYRGGVRQRDGAYHQGTVWPWLIGPFVEAWLRVRRNTAAARREARERFVEPLLRHLDDAGLGHVSEVADAAPPHTPGGCPFQAWSLGEVLRLDRVVLADGEGGTE
jgi:predicted glycogen debranching enzyme